MAFNRKNWQDNVSDITAAELNRMEQGIYDNSLVVDAVTNTINPTDTETYKTAELTEGQITDVIGVNDIVIKGQTSQDGTPTPSAPVDVNVVSGSNTIDICGKNLFDGVFRQGNRYTTGLSETTRLFTTQNYFVKQGQQYTLSTTLGSNYKYAINLSTIKFPIPANTQYFYDSGWKTGTFTFTPDQDGYLGIVVSTTNGSDNLSPSSISSYTWQLEKGSTATAYEPHQGKELHLDLPVENLLKKENVNKIDCLINNGTKTISNYSGCKTLYIPIKGEKTYTVSKKASARFVVGSCSSLPANNVVCSNTIQDNNAKSLTLTTNANDTYLAVFYYLSGTDTLTEQEILDSIQIEQGSKANAYTPYGTEPIELCKIGNYQDYFYKSGSKWYLHKEIGKYTITGSSDESWVLNSSGTYYKYQWTAALPDKYNVVNTPLYCDHFTQITVAQGNDKNVIGIVNGYYNGYSLQIVCDISTLADFTTWLAENTPVVYYPLATATDTQITDTNLISQLEAIYNAPLYEQTNITQENNDLPMVLDITACKDNINGIKAFIRK